MIGEIKVNLGLSISWWVLPYMRTMYFLRWLGLNIPPRKIERFAVRYGMKLKVEKNASEVGQ